MAFFVFVGGSECSPQRCLPQPATMALITHTCAHTHTHSHTPETCNSEQHPAKPSSLSTENKTDSHKCRSMGRRRRNKPRQQRGGKKTVNHTTIWKNQKWQGLPAALIHLCASSDVAQGIGNMKNGGWARPWALEPQSLACTTKASAILTYDEWFSLLDKHGKRWRMSHRQAAILPSAAGLQPSAAFALYPFILSLFLTLSPSLSLSVCLSCFIPLLQSQDKSERVYDLYTA